METVMTDSALRELFLEADRLFSTGALDEAEEKYAVLAEAEQFASFAYYRLGHIQNLNGKPLAAKALYYQAFKLKPDLCRVVLPEDHPNCGYVFRGCRDEPPQKHCPLCNVPGEPHWCYFMPEAPSPYARGYNPVRVWVRCEHCNHLYAEEFPELRMAVSPPGSPPPARIPTQASLFPHYSRVLNQLARYTDGSELLDVGFGGCECSLAARELGYYVYGLDIMEGCVEQAQEYGLVAEQQDFLLFETTRKWDIITMGDVLGQVADPVTAMEKARDLLRDGGVLWLSTPNFESAYATYADHEDPMRREASHRNYFSRESIFALIERVGLDPVRQEISELRNGSMEIIARK